MADRFHRVCSTCGNPLAFDGAAYAEWKRSQVKITRDMFEERDGVLRGDAEASSLMLPPGQWPSLFTVDEIGKFEIHFIEADRVVYATDMFTAFFTIWND